VEVNEKVNVELFPLEAKTRGKILTQHNIPQHFAGTTPDH